MAASPLDQYLAPGALWKFLGERKGEPFRPFPAQAEALSLIRTPWPGMKPDGGPYPTIFGVCCGRRFGKTTLAEKILWQGLIAPDDAFGPPTVRLTADTEEHGHKVWDRFTYHLMNTDLKALLREWNKDRNLVTLLNGATAQLISANNPAALSGDAVTLWVVDESQELTYEAWNNLYPSTADRDGVIVLVGVAENDGPFREICWKGASEDHPDYMRLSYPTAANPFVPRRRIELAASEMDPSRFKQLFLAQWVDEVGKIFRNVEGCIILATIQRHEKGWGFIEPPKPGHLYYGGLDLARLSDWLVFSIFDRAGRLVAWDRFNKQSWELSKHRCFELSKAYDHLPVRADATGVGDPVVEDLQRMGMKVDGVQISTNLQKRNLVDDLAIQIGMGARQFPRIQVLVEELSRFEAKRSQIPGSSTLIYTAPAGMTDDFVMSLALANSLLPKIHRPREEDEDGEYERERGAWEAL